MRYWSRFLHTGDWQATIAEEWKTVHSSFPKTIQKDEWRSE
jgi:hypothetical protein